MNLDIQRIRAICFDIDGTLSDTDDLYMLRLSGMLTPLKFFLKGKDTKASARRLITTIETPGNWLLSLADKMGIDDELGRAVDFLQRISKRATSHRHLLVPGVTEMLEMLYPRFPMSIVSARRHYMVLHFLQAFNLTRFFPVIASAQTCTHTKPYPDQILWAARQMGIAPQACVMVGDTVVDIQAGKAAGAQTVGVLCGFGTADELHQAGADLIIESTSELAPLLGNISDVNPRG